MRLAVIVGVLGFAFIFLLMRSWEGLLLALIVGVGGALDIWLIERRKVRRER